MFCLFFFFFNDTATTEIYPLSLHDALPISPHPSIGAALVSLPNGRLQIRIPGRAERPRPSSPQAFRSPPPRSSRSEEHTSELQSLAYLVCRLLLEKKKNYMWH